MNLSGKSSALLLSATSRLSAAGAEQAAGLRRRWLGAALGVLSLTLGIGLAASSDGPGPALSLGIALLLLPVLWRWPSSGAYLLAGGALLFETYGLGYPDSLTDKFPFFKRLSAIGAPSAFFLSPAEMLMFLPLAVFALQRVLAKERPVLFLGPAFPFAAALAAAMALGLARGVSSGGDPSVALWEARGLTYFGLAYLTGVNLLRGPGQVKQVVWLVLIAVAVKGVLGSWRYVVTLEGDLGRVAELGKGNSLMAHEESLFFALFVALAAALTLFRMDRRQQVFALLASMPVALALLANQRRAGILEAVLCIAVIGVVAYASLRHRRKLLRTAFVVAALVVPVYLWSVSGGQGVLAQPARAVASMFSPNERDLSSNTYREKETQSLKANIEADPLLGAGYGRPIEWVVKVPDLSAIFPFWEYIPHNTVLWLWLRMGLLGFLAFWLLIGRVIVHALLVARKTQAPYLQGAAAFAVAALAAWIAQGAVDMGFADLRACTVAGILAGMVCALPEPTGRPPLKPGRRRTAPLIISGL